jgi:uncharacterized OsmC-like protein
MLAADPLAMESGPRLGGRDKIGHAGGELADSVSSLNGRRQPAPSAMPSQLTPSDDLWPLGRRSRLHLEILQIVLEPQTEVGLAWRVLSTNTINLTKSEALMSTTTSLNQVDLQAVGALVQSVQDDPSAAGTTWAANVRWTGAFRSESQVRSFPPVASDEPASLGGTDTAPNPVEQLLSALGNCLAVGYAANASVAGITIKELSIAVDGDVDLRSFLGLAAGHAGFSAIRVKVDLKADASADAVAALHAKVAATSPVGHSLQAAVPVEITPA